MMKTAILILGLIGLIQAEVVVKHLNILEGDLTYTQTVTLDYDRNVQIIEVPAHHNIVHSRTIFDFRNGKLIESHPDEKVCYLKEISKNIAPMKKFADFLDKKTKSVVVASNEKRAQKSFATTRRVGLKTVSSLTKEAYAECSGSSIYEVTQVSNDIRQVSFNPAPYDAYKQLMTTRLGDCHMPANCLWQTCYVGSDSCYWTVNCPVTDDDCNDLLHESDFHTDGVQVTCHPCYNMMCQGCTTAWTDGGCGPVFEAHGVPKCPTGPDYEKDCGAKHCQYPNDQAGGEYQCPADGLENGGVEAGHTCILYCQPGNGFGGVITCQDDGKWDESMLSGC